MINDTLVIDDGNCRIVINKFNIDNAAKRYLNSNTSNPYNTSFAQGPKVITFIPTRP